MLTTVQLMAALLKKGFVLIDSAKHNKLVLETNGVRRSVWTLVSRSNRDIPKNLESAIARELRMRGAAYLREFAECGVSEEQYVQLLIDNGTLK